MFIELKGVTYNTKFIAAYWQNKDMIFMQGVLMPADQSPLVAIKCDSADEAKEMKDLLDECTKAK